ncbi:DUF354 domain-containing protein [Algiphilus aromaticivorans]|uniref:DUF354 domain-containing protein n=1 Tax=Algiphilus aromaticivorans TaxID=382454 RepID=UPI000693F0A4|nr:DUF354 domain-containing protein [Algiphilus aromaticivorans]
MRVLIDIGHPAHVHFFKNPIRLLRDRGDKVLVTSRDKECAVPLLDQLGVEHRCLSAQHDGGAGGMARELVQRNRALIRQVRDFRPDVITGVGGIFAAQTGFLTRTRSVVFYDTERATLQNALTYPFASRIVVPECYEGWTPKRRTVRYRGCHELSYLHPRYFQPDIEKAYEAGLARSGNTFLLRLVSWKANHDLHEKGWPLDQLQALVKELTKMGHLIISSEAELPVDLAPYAYNGRADQMHHLMAFCRAFIGESATMASECAVLGVPSLYVARESQFRGYITWHNRETKLVRHVADHDLHLLLYELQAITAPTVDQRRRQREAFLDSCLDVPELVVHALRR